MEKKIKIIADEEYVKPEPKKVEKTEAPAKNEDAVAEKKERIERKLTAEEFVGGVLQSLNLKGEIEKTEDEYKAHVAQGGTNLSGGQRQRVSIARAIARRPEIVIFDDSFSALDYKTDRKLRGLLKKELAGTTMMVVAQRIGTITEADQIIVLDEGKIVGKGTHDELMANCEVYQEIAYSQLSKEELA